MLIYNVHWFLGKEYKDAIELPTGYIFCLNLEKNLIKEISWIEDSSNNLFIPIEDWFLTINTDVQNYSLTPSCINEEVKIITIMSIGIFMLQIFRLGSDGRAFHLYILIFNNIDHMSARHSVSDFDRFLIHLNLALIFSRNTHFTS